MSRFTSSIISEAFSQVGHHMYTLFKTFRFVIIRWLKSSYIYFFIWRVCTTWYAPIHAQFCHISWFPFCSAQYREKQQKGLELLNYFMEGIKTNRVCVLIFLLLSCNLVLWYELNKKYWNILLCFPIWCPTKRKPTWRSRV